MRETKIKIIKKVQKSCLFLFPPRDRDTREKDQNRYRNYFRAREYDPFPICCLSIGDTLLIEQPIAPRHRRRVMHSSKIATHLKINRYSSDIGRKEIERREFGGVALRSPPL